MFCRFWFLGIEPYNVCYVIKCINSMGDQPEGVGFPFPSLLFYEGCTYGQPEVVNCRKSMPDTAERGNCTTAIFHFTVKIVGRSKGKSIISASAYLNGDVMKNEETGRISYYTKKKKVVYTSLMMCENAPSEWMHVPEENIKRFQQSIHYKRADDKNPHWKSSNLHFRNSGYGMRY